jgi:hypothetical protein
MTGEGQPAVMQRCFLWVTGGRSATPATIIELLPLDPQLRTNTDNLAIDVVCQ